MSHFSTVKTQIKHRDALILALQAMNLAYEEDKFHNNLEMKTRWGQDQKYFASLVVRSTALNCGADVGFSWGTETQAYSIIADDWELKRSSIPNFRQKLIEEYTVQVAIKSGYRVTNRTIAADGRMQIEIEPETTVQVRR